VAGSKRPGLLALADRWPLTVRVGGGGADGTLGSDGRVIYELIGSLINRWGSLDPSNVESMLAAEILR
jgi:hypothetical protein